MYAKRFGLGALAAASALAFAAAPAGATTIRSGSVSGPLYSGAVNATLASSSLDFTSTLSNVSCNQSTNTGSTDSAGIGSTTGATWNTNGGACIDSVAGTTTITARLLPWTATTAYAPVRNGRNGTVTIKTYSKAVRADGITCYFKGGGTGDTITLDLYNPDNPNKPLPGVAGAQTLANETLVKDTTQVNSFLCPSTATMSGVYSQAGSGGTALWVAQ